MSEKTGKAGKRGRGRGEGTIYYREEKQLWCCQVRLENGRRRTLYGKTRQEVARKLGGAQREIEDGLVSATRRQKFGPYLLAWMETKRHTIEESTWLRYEIDVRVHIVPALGRMELAKVSAQDLQVLYAARLRAGAAPGTIKHMHSVVHSALEDAVRLGLVVRNVSALVKKPAVKRADLPILQPEEVERFRESLVGDRLEALYVLALATGMREGELLALRWRDVDLERGTIGVRVSQGRVKRDGRYEWVVGDVKTASSRRLVRIADGAEGMEAGAGIVSLLRAHRARQLEERMRAGVAWRGGDWVFCSEIGERLTGHQVLHRLKRALERGGVPRVRFHALRHTAATMLLLHGVPVKVVSEMLGHASVVITMDIYGHVLPDMQAQAADVMSGLLARKVRT